MAYTKDEFYQAALNEACNSEILAERIQIGDVTVTQQIGAMAQMLAMLSMQIDLGLSETWTRARDSFVIADAAAKQMLPFGQAKIAQITVKNEFQQPLTLQAGRILLDARARQWVIREGTIIPANGESEVTVIQYQQSCFTHKVTELKSFYRIPIPVPDSNQCLIAVEVSKSPNNVVFKHVESFNNINYNEYVYHVMGDEILNLYIEFGLKDKFGYVPGVGEEFKITIKQSYYNFDLELGTQLSLEYAGDNEEYLSFFTTRELKAGSPPASISEMRELGKYPYMYNENAVYLGEFSQLIMRQLRPFVFLSVWNEYIEEQVRGADIDNINRLFVSFIKDGISSEEAQNEITAIVRQADDSYRIKFVPASENKITFNVHLWLSPLHDSMAIAKKVKLWVLKKYGRQSVWARSGRQRINISNITKQIKEEIAELNDGTSDIVITVNDTSLDLPESFRYVDETSLTIATTGLTPD
jgi:hypothetical protein